MKRFLKWTGSIALLTIIGLVIAFWTPDTKIQAMRAKYGGPGSQFIDLGNGLTVHLRDEGPREGPVIVLLHGSNSFLQTWDDWTKRLTPTYRVIRFDLPGHGMTGAYPARAYSTAAFAEVVDRITAKLGVDHFILGGNSMGGGVAWAYAHKHPEKLSGLVLVDASGQPEAKPKSLPIGFRIARTPGIRDIMLYITPRSIIEKSLHQSVSHQEAVTPASIDRYWELLRYPGNRQATIDRFATPRDRAVAGAPRLPVPTLIMWGAEDKLIPVASAAWFKQQVPEAKVIIYPGVGHLMMEEIPERSASDLSNWLASLPKPR
jgi:pimeloyl-ACP methyl ester carboxylesterase